MKEDERIERTIRSFMKLPENRRCINCNNLGPQYVCITFLTFVCTNCSGIHREFTHRVKSVSMAKFTAEEVNALQAAGNKQAREIYFRTWDHQRFSFPDGSNLRRLREFIKHVYVDKKYSGERSCLTLSDKDEISDSRAVDAHHGKTRGQSIDDKYFRHPTERSSSFGKDDGRAKSTYEEIRRRRYSGDNLRIASHARNPVKFEVVDDRFRDDRFGNRGFSLGDPASQRSPKKNANTDSPTSPVVRPLQDILGQNCPTLEVAKISEENKGDHLNKNDTVRKPAEVKTEIPRSLIDFGPETEIKTEGPDTSPQAPKVQTLESLLFGPLDLSATSASEIFDLSTRSDNMLVAATPPVPEQQMPEIVDSTVSVAEQLSNENLLQFTDDWSFGNIQQSEPSPPVVAEDSSISQTATLTTNSEATLQPGFSSFSNDGLGSSSIHTQQALPEETNTDSSCRKELPSDLFTINPNYQAMAAPVSGWQTVSQGMGFNYFPNTMAFQNPVRSTNPFDISDEQSQFPSMASLQGALPNAPTGMLLTSSAGTYSSANAHLMNPNLPFLGSALAPNMAIPGAYMGQETHTSLQHTLRPQGLVTAVPSGTYWVPANPTASSTGGGNPFG